MSASRSIQWAYVKQPFSSPDLHPETIPISATCSSFTFACTCLPPSCPSMQRLRAQWAVRRGSSSRNRTSRSFFHTCDSERGRERGRTMDVVKLQCYTCFRVAWWPSLHMIESGVTLRPINHRACQPWCTMTHMDEILCRLHPRALPDLPKPILGSNIWVEAASMSPCVYERGKICPTPGKSEANKGCHDGHASVSIAGQGS